MRKCRSCGYILLGEGETCGRCGAPLTAVSVGAAAPAAAPAAAAPAAAAPAGAWPPAPAPAPPTVRAGIPGLPPAGPPPPSGPPVGAPGGAQPLPALRESWQPVAISAPASTHQPRSTRVGVIALVVAIVLAVGAGAMHFRSDPLPAGTSEFASGGGVTYTSPDGAFQVQLPKAPVLEQQAIPMNGVTSVLYTAVASTDDYEIGGGSMALPTTMTPAQADTALDLLMTGAIKGVDGKISEKHSTMRGTMPAIEGHFKDSHGYPARMLVVLSRSNLIVLLVHAKSGVDRLYKALDASLIIR